MDIFSSEVRSRIMSCVKAKDTTPERIVRKTAHRIGFRFRLYRKDLPGKPDLVFPSKRKVIFVHGCFWHQHLGCPRSRRPSSNQVYWEKKLERNKVRDSSVIECLKGIGWEALVIWECQTLDQSWLENELRRFLESD